MAETSRTVAPPAVRLHMESVPYRSAAWRELWRRLFAAIEADLAADVLTEPTTAEGTGGVTC